MNICGNCSLAARNHQAGEVVIYVQQSYLITRIQEGLQGTSNHFHTTLTAKVNTPT